MYAVRLNLSSPPQLLHLCSSDQALADKASAATGGMTTLVLASILAAMAELGLVDCCAGS
jgi:hypothetical protein